MKKHVAILFFLLTSSTAYAGSCPSEKYNAADDAVGTLTNWNNVNQYFIKYGKCDDGSVSEATSDAVARLLAEHWDTLPDLEKLAHKNPALRKYVLWHINTTLNGDDVEKIGKLATDSCPKGLISFCNDLKKKVKEVNAEFLKPAN